MKWEPEAQLATFLQEGGAAELEFSPHRKGAVRVRLSHSKAWTGAGLGLCSSLQPRPGPSLQSSLPGEGGPLPNKLAEKSRAANGSFNHKSWFHVGQERTGRR